MPKKLTNEDRLEIVSRNLQEAWRHLPDSGKLISLTEIRQSLHHCEFAVCALRAMECSLSGIPEPEEG